MIPEFVTDVVIGLGISGLLLYVGLISWYHPTLILYLFDHYELDPWPQVLFTPAAYIGGWFFVVLLGVSLYFVQAIVSVGIGVAVLLRHERNPRNDDSIWPSRRAANASLGIGVVFALAGTLSMLGLV